MDYNTVYIMRGISGSGKSTLAHKLASQPGDTLVVVDGIQYYLDKEGMEHVYYAKHEEKFVPYNLSKFRKECPIKAAIHSADQYFIVNGEYRFDPRALGRNHQKNQYAFGKSLEMNIPIVICDNTNTKIWEMSKYIKKAKDAGYSFAVVTLPHPTAEVAFTRNSHGVPKDKIEEMIRRWEPWKN